MKKHPYINQVIINEKGNSWLGAYLFGEKIDATFKSILTIYKNNMMEYHNVFWVMDFNGDIKAVQSKLENALKYYNSENRILIHFQENFV